MQTASPVITDLFNPIRSARVAVMVSPNNSARPMALVPRPSATIVMPNDFSIQAPYTTNRLSLAALTKKMKASAPRAAFSRNTRCQAAFRSIFESGRA